MSDETFDYEACLGTPSFDYGAYMRDRSDDELKVIDEGFAQTLANLADSKMDALVECSMNLRNAALAERLRRLLGVETGPVRVEKSRILATDDVCYTVWVPCDGPMGRFATLTTLEGVWYGRVGTDRLTPDLDKLKPGSDERIVKVREFMEKRYAVAYEAILLAFPEARDGRRSMGEITVTVKKNAVYKVYTHSLNSMYDPAPRPPVVAETVHDEEEAKRLVAEFQTHDTASWYTVETTDA